MSRRSGVQRSPGHPPWLKLPTGSFRSGKATAGGQWGVRPLFPSSQLPLPVAMCQRLCRVRQLGQCDQVQHFLEHVTWEAENCGPIKNTSKARHVACWRRIIRVENPLSKVGKLLFIYFLSHWSPSWGRPLRLSAPSPQESGLTGFTGFTAGLRASRDVSSPPSVLILHTKEESKKF